MNKNALFTPYMRMADVIHENFNLIPIINRFGVQFGFGNKTVEEVCEQNGINSNFFLEILNSYCNAHYFPTDYLKSFSVQLIIDHLIKTHKYYTTVKVPEIEIYIHKLIEIRNQDKNIALLKNFFNDYVKELHVHLNDEDDNVFPYILKLDNALQNKVADKNLIDLIKYNPISKYERNHSDLESSLNDLKNLIIKFLPPINDTNICQNLLIDLYRLEKDLKNHAIIEEKVLVPKVKFLEKEYLNHFDSK